LRVDPFSSVETRKMSPRASKAVHFPSLAAAIDWIVSFALTARSARAHWSLGTSTATFSTLPNVVVATSIR
jgi:hypothetical protein